MARFVHHDLRLLNPSFSSPLLDVLTELEHLRRLELRGTTPVPVYSAHLARRPLRRALRVRPRAPPSPASRKTA